MMKQLTAIALSEHRIGSIIEVERSWPNAKTALDMKVVSSKHVGGWANITSAV
jgi:hypothetical protein